MEKYLIYNKNFDLVKRFGKERYDILAYGTLNNHFISRAWDVSTPDHVENGIAIEMIVDSGILIRMGLKQNDFICRAEQTILFSDLNEDNLFAETLHYISCAMRTGDVRICRRIADEWKFRGKIERYGEAHRFLIDNH